MPINLQARTFKSFWEVLPGQKQLCVFLRNKYGFQIGNTREKINSILTRKKCWKLPDTPHVGFWACQFQWHRFWGCTFRCFWVMGYMYALSWKLLIIGLLSEYFATLLKILHLKKMTAKCSIFLHQLYLFLMGRPRTFLGDKDQMLSGEDKRKG